MKIMRVLTMSLIKWRKDRIHKNKLTMHNERRREKCFSNDLNILDQAI